ncbi:hypothetical protein CMI47_02055 [Candidatus Pacearchaeota archaeon]|jgi:hypothetical protein|nr:hypothetical protein [Candidatus Pacearchaeota archaeon]|tara:strand:- start:2554 stop:3153 length:600 start_codon:yes stop_codon:yes gene_type:complete
MAYKIIQASYPGTGSTVLVNCILGLLSPHEHLRFRKTTEEYTRFPLQTIFKTHHIVLKDWEKIMPNDSIFFALTERRDSTFGDLIDKFKRRGESVRVMCGSPPSIALLPEECHTRSNCVVFQYEELLETPEYTIEQIITTVQKKLLLVLPEVFRAPLLDNYQKAINRIYEMNAFYESIKHLKHKSYINMYGICPQHRSQ